jgi:hypothetical protein
VFRAVLILVVFLCAFAFHPVFANFDRISVSRICQSNIRQRNLISLTHIRIANKRRWKQNATNRQTRRRQSHAKNPHIPPQKGTNQTNNHHTRPLARAKGSLHRTKHTQRTSLNKRRNNQRIPVHKKIQTHTKRRKNSRISGSNRKHPKTITHSETFLSQFCPKKE